MNAELAVTGHRLFSRDRDEGRKADNVEIMVKDTILAVLRLFYVFPSLMPLSVTSALRNLTIICVYLPQGGICKPTPLFELCSHLYWTVSFVSS